MPLGLDHLHSSRKPTLSSHSSCRATRTLVGWKILAYFCSSTCISACVTQAPRAVIRSDIRIALHVAPLIYLYINKSEIHPYVPKRRQNHIRKHQGNCAQVLETRPCSAQPCSYLLNSLSHPSTPPGSDRSPISCQPLRYIRTERVKETPSVAHKSHCIVRSNLSVLPTVFVAANSLLFSILLVSLVP
jgi:hypothetical protein